MVSDLDVAQRTINAQAKQVDAMQTQLANAERALADVERAITDCRIGDVNRSPMWRNGARAIAAQVRLALVMHQSQRDDADQ